MRRGFTIALVASAVAVACSEFSESTAAVDAGTDGGIPDAVAQDVPPMNTTDAAPAFLRDDFDDTCARWASLASGTTRTIVPDGGTSPVCELCATRIDDIHMQRTVDSQGPGSYDFRVMIREAAGTPGAWKLVVLAVSDSGANAIANTGGVTTPEWRQAQAVANVTTSPRLTFRIGFRSNTISDCIYVDDAVVDRFP